MSSGATGAAKGARRGRHDRRSDGSVEDRGVDRHRDADLDVRSRCRLRDHGERVRDRTGPGLLRPQPALVLAVEPPRAAQEVPHRRDGEHERRQQEQLDEEGGVRVGLAVTHGGDQVAEDHGEKPAPAHDQRQRPELARLRQPGEPDADHAERDRDGGDERKQARHALDADEHAQDRGEQHHEAVAGDGDQQGTAVADGGRRAAAEPAADSRFGDGRRAGRRGHALPILSGAPVSLRPRRRFSSCWAMAASRRSVDPARCRWQRERRPDSPAS